MSSRKPSGDDLIWLASITKTFTSLLLFQLRDEGLLSLDDPVEGFFPPGEFGYKSPWATQKPMTLRQLASHTSGLPRQPACDSSSCGDTNKTEGQILAALKTNWLVVKPGSRFHYSNLAFSVLGRALGHAANASYESLVEERILKPLGMTSATFSTPQSLENVAVGLTPSGEPGMKFHADGWGAPCGDLLASANDMSKYMRLYARRDDKRDNAAQVIDGASITEILQPAVQLRDGSSAVGYPWEFKFSTSKRGGLWYKSKQGGDPGYRSSLTLAPDLNLGIFVSALTDPLPGGEDSAWTVPAADILTAALLDILWSHKPHAPIADASRYEGQYNGNWSVWQSPDGTLQARFGGDVVNLTALSPPPSAGESDGEAESAVAGVFEAHSASAPDQQLGCRWLDDGTDQELAYFEFDSDIGMPGTRSSAVVFMGSRRARAS